MDIKAYIRKVRAENAARAESHRAFKWPLRLVAGIIVLAIAGILNEVSMILESSQALDQEGLKVLFENEQ